MNTFEQIKNGMALAFFACAYADLCEEKGEPLSGQIMDQLPQPTDPAAIRAAETLIMGMIDGVAFEPGLDSDEKRMRALYMHAVNQTEGGTEGHLDLNPDLFGHYCAMQAMGTGVGLDSFGSAIYEAFIIPDIDFGSCNLENDYH